MAEQTATSYGSMTPQSAPETTLPSPGPVQETVVIPNVQGGQPSQFMPQSVASEGYTPASGANVARGSSCVSRILLLVVILLILTGLGAGGWFAWNYISANKQVTITYWGLWENEPTVRAVIDEFEKTHPNISVEYIKQSHKQYRERLVSAIDRGEGPDVFRFHNTWVPMIVKQLTPVPKTIMPPETFITTFYPVAKNDLLTSSGTIYGLPMMIDGLGLYINEDLFAAAGVSVPTTWEDIIKTGGLVERLTVREGDTIVTSAIALGTSTNVEHFSDILAVMMMQNGAKLTDPTSEETEGTLLFYRRFSDPGDPLYTWSSALESSIPAFASGRVAMIIAPSWRAFDIKQINPGLNFRIVPIPQLSGTSINWASYWVEGVSSASKLQPQAWEFVRYMTSREAVTALYSESAKTRLFGEPYALVELGKQLESDPYVGAYVKQASTSRSFPLASRTSDNGINDNLIQYLENAVTGVVNGSSPKEALKTYASGMQQVFSKYNLTVANSPAK